MGVSTPKGCHVVSFFVMTYFLLRGYNILSKLRNSIRAFGCKFEDFAKNFSHKMAINFAA